MTTAAEICTTAAQIVAGDRNRTHGDKLENHQKIAALWNAYLAIRRDPAAPLDPVDVALMMDLLKTARIHSGEHNPDNYVDKAGYAACAGEIAERLRESV